MITSQSKHRILQDIFQTLIFLANPGLEKILDVFSCCSRRYFSCCTGDISRVAARGLGLLLQREI